MSDIQFLIRDILLGLFERQGALRKTSWGMVFGAIFFLLFAIVGYHGFFRTKPPEGDLVGVEGIVSEARNEKGHKRDLELVVTLEGTDVRMRSSNPYPSTFGYGSQTPDHLLRGERVTFLLHRSESERAPRKHRLHNYSWREFVGLRDETSVHLTPHNHYRWHRENRKMGQILFSIMAAGGLLMSILCYRERGKIRKGGGRARVELDRSGSGW